MDREWTHRCWLGWLTPCSTFDRAPVRVRANHAMASLAEGLPPPPKKASKIFSLSACIKPLSQARLPSLHHHIT